MLVNAHTNWACTVLYVREPGQPAAVSSTCAGRTQAGWEGTRGGLVSKSGTPGFLDQIRATGYSRSCS